MKLNERFGLPVRRPLFLLTLYLCLTAFAAYAQQSEPEKRVGEDGFVWYKVRKRGEGLTVLDANKKEIIPSSRGYNNASFYDAQHGYFKILKWHNENESSWGICDKTGREIIPPDRRYSACWYEEKQGYYMVKKGRYTGICDKEGREIISPDRKYTQCNPYRGWFKVKAGDYVGYCDKEGKEFIPISRGYTHCQYIVHYFSVKKKNNLMGVCDSTGREIIPPVWNYVVWNSVKKIYMGRKSQDSKAIPVDLDNPLPPR